jgi:hypothetical protein
MTIVRFSIGGGTLLLSVLGLLICLAGAVGVWMFKSRVEAVAHAASTVLAVWLGVSQIGMMCSGWQIMKAHPASGQ